MIGFKEHIGTKILALCLIGVFMFSQLTWTARVDFTTFLLPNLLIHYYNNRPQEKPEKSFLKGVMDGINAVINPAAFAQSPDFTGHRDDGLIPEAFKKAWAKPTQEIKTRITEVETIHIVAQDADSQEVTPIDTVDMVEKILDIFATGEFDRSSSTKSSELINVEESESEIAGLDWNGLNSNYKVTSSNNGGLIVIGSTIYKNRKLVLSKASDNTWHIIGFGMLEFKATITEAGELIVTGADAATNTASFEYAGVTFRNVKLSPETIKFLADRSSKITNITISYNLTVINNAQFSLDSNGDAIITGSTGDNNHISVNLNNNTVTVSGDMDGFQEDANQPYRANGDTNIIHVEDDPYLLSQTEEIGKVEVLKLQEKRSSLQEVILEATDDQYQNIHELTEGEYDTEKDDTVVVVGDEVDSRTSEGEVEAVSFEDISVIEFLGIKFQLQPANIFLPFFKIMTNKGDETTEDIVSQFAPLIYGASQIIRKIIVNPVIDMVQKIESIITYFTTGPPKGNNPINSNLILNNVTNFIVNIVPAFKTPEPNKGINVEYTKTPPAIDGVSLYNKGPPESQLDQISNPTVSLSQETTETTQNKSSDDPTDTQDTEIDPNDIIDEIPEIPSGPGPLLSFVSDLFWAVILYIGSAVTAGSFPWISEGLKTLANVLLGKALITLGMDIFFPIDDSDNGGPKNNNNPLDITNPENVSSTTIHAIYNVNGVVIGASTIYRNWDGEIFLRTHQYHDGSFESIAEIEVSGTDENGNAYHFNPGDIVVSGEYVIIDEEISYEVEVPYLDKDGNEAVKTITVVIPKGTKVFYTNDRRSGSESYKYTDLEGDDYYFVYDEKGEATGVSGIVEFDQDFYMWDPVNEVWKGFDAGKYSFQADLDNDDPYIAFYFHSENEASDGTWEEIDPAIGNPNRPDDAITFKDAAENIMENTPDLLEKLISFIFGTIAFVGGIVLEMLGAKFIGGFFKRLGFDTLVVLGIEAVLWAIDIVVSPISSPSENNDSVQENDPATENDPIVTDDQGDNNPSDQGNSDQVSEPVEYEKGDFVFAINLSDHRSETIGEGGSESIFIFVRGDLIQYSTIETIDSDQTNPLALPTDIDLDGVIDTNQTLKAGQYMVTYDLISGLKHYYDEDDKLVVSIALIAQTLLDREDEEVSVNQGDVVVLGGFDIELGRDYTIDVINAIRTIYDESGDNAEYSITLKDREGEKGDEFKAGDTIELWEYDSDGDLLTHQDLLENIFTRVFENADGSKTVVSVDRDYDLNNNLSREITTVTEKDSDDNILSEVIIVKDSLGFTLDISKTTYIYDSEGDVVRVHMEGTTKIFGILPIHHETDIFLAYDDKGKVIGTFSVSCVGTLTTVSFALLSYDANDDLSFSIGGEWSSANPLVGSLSIASYDGQGEVNGQVKLNFGYDISKESYVFSLNGTTAFEFEGPGGRTWELELGGDYHFIGEASDELIDLFFKLTIPVTDLFEFTIGYDGGFFIAPVWTLKAVIAATEYELDLGSEFTISYSGEKATLSPHVALYAIDPDGERHMIFGYTADIDGEINDVPDSNSITVLLESIFSPIIEKILQTALFKSVIIPFFEGIKETINNFVDTLITPIINGIKEAATKFLAEVIEPFVAELTENLTKLWDEVIAPVFTKVTENLTKLWDEAIAPFFAEVTKNLTKFWDEVIVAPFTKIIENLTKFWDEVVVAGINVFTESMKTVIQNIVTSEFWTTWIEPIFNNEFITWDTDARSTSTVTFPPYIYSEGAYGDFAFSFTNDNGDVQLNITYTVYDENHNETGVYGITTGSKDEKFMVGFSATINVYNADDDRIFGLGINSNPFKEQYGFSLFTDITNDVISIKTDIVLGSTEKEVEANIGFDVELYDADGEKVISFGLTLMMDEEEVATSNGYFKVFGKGDEALIGVNFSASSDDDDKGWVNFGYGVEFRISDAKDQPLIGINLSIGETEEGAQFTGHFILYDKSGNAFLALGQTFADTGKISAYISYAHYDARDNKIFAITQQTVQGIETLTMEFNTYDGYDNRVLGMSTMFADNQLIASNVAFGLRYSVAVPRNSEDGGVAATMEFGVQGNVLVGDIPTFFELIGVEADQAVEGVRIELESYTKNMIGDEYDEDGNMTKAFEFTHTHAGVTTIDASDSKWISQDESIHLVSNVENSFDSKRRITYSKTRSISSEFSGLLMTTEISDIKRWDEDGNPLEYTKDTNYKSVMLEQLGDYMQLVRITVLAEQVGCKKHGTPTFGIEITNSDGTSRTYELGGVDSTKDSYTVHVFFNPSDIKGISVKQTNNKRHAAIDVYSVSIQGNTFKMNDGKDNDAFLISKYKGRHPGEAGFTDRFMNYNEKVIQYDARINWKGDLTQWKEIITSTQNPGLILEKEYTVLPTGYLVNTHAQGTDYQGNLHLGGVATPLTVDYTTTEIVFALPIGTITWTTNALNNTIISEDIDLFLDQNLEFQIGSYEDLNRPKYEGDPKDQSWSANNVFQADETSFVVKWDQQYNDLNQVIAYKYQEDGEGKTNSWFGATYNTGAQLEAYQVKDGRTLAWAHAIEYNTLGLKTSEIVSSCTDTSKYTSHTITQSFYQYNINAMIQRTTEDVLKHKVWEKGNISRFKAVLKVIVTVLCFFFPILLVLVFIIGMIAHRVGGAFEEFFNDVFQGIPIVENIYNAGKAVGRGDFGEAFEYAIAAVVEYALAMATYGAYYFVSAFAAAAQQAGLNDRGYLTSYWMDAKVLSCIPLISKLVAMKYAALDGDWLSFCLNLVKLVFDIIVIVLLALAAISLQWWAIPLLVAYLVADTVINVFFVYGGPQWLYWLAVIVKFICSVVAMGGNPVDASTPLNAAKSWLKEFGAGLVESGSAWAPLLVPAINFTIGVINAMQWIGNWISKGLKWLSNKLAEFGTAVKNFFGIASSEEVITQTLVSQSFDEFGQMLLDPIFEQGAMTLGPQITQGVITQTWFESLVDGFYSHAPDASVGIKVHTTMIDMGLNFAIAEILEEMGLSENAVGIFSAAIVGAIGGAFDGPSGDFGTASYYQGTTIMQGFAQGLAAGSFNQLDLAGFESALGMAFSTAFGSLFDGNPNTTFNDSLFNSQTGLEMFYTGIQSVADELGLVMEFTPIGMNLRSLTYEDGNLERYMISATISVVTSMMAQMVFGDSSDDLSPAVKIAFSLALNVVLFASFKQFAGRGLSDQSGDFWTNLRQSFFAEITMDELDSVGNFMYRGDHLKSLSIYYMNIFGFTQSVREDGIEALWDRMGGSLVKTFEGLLTKGFTESDSFKAYVFANYGKRVKLGNMGEIRAFKSGRVEFTPNLDSNQDLDKAFMFFEQTMREAFGFEGFISIDGFTAIGWLDNTSYLTGDDFEYEINEYLVSQIEAQIDIIQEKLVSMVKEKADPNPSNDGDLYESSDDKNESLDYIHEYEFMLSFVIDDIKSEYILDDEALCLLDELSKKGIETRAGPEGISFIIKTDDNEEYMYLTGSLDFELRVKELTDKVLAILGFEQEVSDVIVKGQSLLKEFNSIIQTTPLAVNEELKQEIKEIVEFKGTTEELVLKILSFEARFNIWKDSFFQIENGVLTLRDFTFKGLEKFIAGNDKVTEFSAYTKEFKEFLEILNLPTNDLLSKKLETIKEFKGSLPELLGLIDDFNKSYIAWKSEYITKTADGWETKDFTIEDLRAFVAGNKDLSQYQFNTMELELILLSIGLSDGNGLSSSLKEIKTFQGSLKDLMDKIRAFNQEYSAWKTESIEFDVVGNFYIKGGISKEQVAASLVNLNELISEINSGISQFSSQMTQMESFLSKIVELSDAGSFISSGLQNVVNFLGSVNSLNDLGNEISAGINHYRLNVSPSLNYKNASSIAIAQGETVGAFTALSDDVVVHLNEDGTVKEIVGEYSIDRNEFIVEYSDGSILLEVVAGEVEVVVTNREGVKTITMAGSDEITVQNVLNDELITLCKNDNRYEGFINSLRIPISNNILNEGLASEGNVSSETIEPIAGEATVSVTEQNGEYLYEGQIVLILDPITGSGIINVFAADIVHLTIAKDLVYMIPGTQKEWVFNKDTKITIKEGNIIFDNTGDCGYSFVEGKFRTAGFIKDGKAVNVMMYYNVDGVEHAVKARISIGGEDVVITKDGERFYPDTKTLEDQFIVEDNGRLLVLPQEIIGKITNSKELKEITLENFIAMIMPVDQEQKEQPSAPGVWGIAWDFYKGAASEILRVAADYYSLGMFKDFLAEVGISSLKAGANFVDAGLNAYIDAYSFGIVTDGVNAKVIDKFTVMNSAKNWSLLDVDMNNRTIFFIKDGKIYQGGIDETAFMKMCEYIKTLPVENQGISTIGVGSQPTVTVDELINSQKELDRFTHAFVALNTALWVVPIAQVVNVARASLFALNTIFSATSRYIISKGAIRAGVGLSLKKAGYRAFISALSYKAAKKVTFVALEKVIAPGFIFSAPYMGMTLMTGMEFDTNTFLTTIALGIVMARFLPATNSLRGLSTGNYNALIAKQYLKNLARTQFTGRMLSFNIWKMGTMKIYAPGIQTAFWGMKAIDKGHEIVTGKEMVVWNSVEEYATSAYIALTLCGLSKFAGSGDMKNTSAISLLWKSAIAKGNRLYLPTVISLVSAKVALGVWDQELRLALKEYFNIEISDAGIEFLNNVINVALVIAILGGIKTPNGTILAQTGRNIRNNSPLKAFSRDLGKSVRSLAGFNKAPMFTYTSFMIRTLNTAGNVAQILTMFNLGFRAIELGMALTLNTAAFFSYIASFNRTGNFFAGVGQVINEKGILQRLFSNRPYSELDPIYRDMNVWKQLTITAEQGAIMGAAFGVIMAYARPILEPILHNIPVVSRAMKYIDDTCGNNIFGVGTKGFPGRIHSFFGEEFIKEALVADTLLKAAGLKLEGAKAQGLAEMAQETITDFMGGKFVFISLNNRLRFAFNSTKKPTIKVVNMSNQDSNSLNTKQEMVNSVIEAAYQDEDYTDMEQAIAMLEMVLGSDTIQISFVNEIGQIDMVDVETKDFSDTLKLRSKMNELFAGVNPMDEIVKIVTTSITATGLVTIEQEAAIEILIDNLKDEEVVKLTRGESITLSGRVIDPKMFKSAHLIGALVFRMAKDKGKDWVENLIESTNEDSFILEVNSNKNIKGYKEYKQYKYEMNRIMGMALASNLFYVGPTNVADQLLQGILGDINQGLLIDLKKSTLRVNYHNKEYQGKKLDLERKSWYSRIPLFGSEWRNVNEFEEEIRVEIAIEKLKVFLAKADPEKDDLFLFGEPEKVQKSIEDIFGDIEQDLMEMDLDLNSVNEIFENNDPLEVKSLLMKIDVILRAKGHTDSYLSLLSKDETALRLMLNGVFGADFFEAIEDGNLDDQTKFDKKLKYLNCGAQSQLAYLLLNSLGIKGLRAFDSYNHATLGIWLEAGKKMQMVDFHYSNFDIIDIENDYEEKEAKFYVAKNKENLTQDDYVYLREATDPASLNFLNITYIHNVMADREKPGSINRIKYESIVEKFAIKNAKLDPAYAKVFSMFSEFLPENIKNNPISIKALKGFAAANQRANEFSVSNINNPTVDGPNGFGGLDAITLIKKGLHLVDNGGELNENKTLENVIKDLRDTKVGAFKTLINNRNVNELDLNDIEILSALVEINREITVGVNNDLNVSAGLNELISYLPIEISTIINTGKIPSSIVMVPEFKIADQVVSAYGAEYKGRSQVKELSDGRLLVVKEGNNAEKLDIEAGYQVILNNIFGENIVPTPIRPINNSIIEGANYVFNMPNGAKGQYAIAFIANEFYFDYLTATEKLDDFDSNEVKITGIHNFAEQMNKRKDGSYARLKEAAHRTMDMITTLIDNGYIYKSLLPLSHRERSWSYRHRGVPGDITNFASDVLAYPNLDRKGVIRDLEHTEPLVYQDLTQEITQSLLEWSFANIAAGIRNFSVFGAINDESVDMIKDILYTGYDRLLNNAGSTITYKAKDKVLTEAINEFSTWYFVKLQKDGVDLMSKDYYSKLLDVVEAVASDFAKSKLAERKAPKWTRIENSSKAIVATTEMSLTKTLDENSKTVFIKQLSSDKTGDVDVWYWRGVSGDDVKFVGANVLDGIKGKTLDGKVWSYTSSGDQPGQFNAPNDAYIDKDSNLVIFDKNGMTVVTPSLDNDNGGNQDLYESDIPVEIVIVSNVLDFKNIVQRRDILVSVNANAPPAVATYQQEINIGSLTNDVFINTAKFIPASREVKTVIETSNDNGGMVSTFVKALSLTVPATLLWYVSVFGATYDLSTTNLIANLPEVVENTAQVINNNENIFIETNPAQFNKCDIVIVRNNEKFAIAHIKQDIDVSAVDVERSVNNFKVILGKEGFDLNQTTAHVVYTGNNLEPVRTIPFLKKMFNGNVIELAYNVPSIYVDYKSDTQTMGVYDIGSVKNQNDRKAYAVSKALAQNIETFTFESDTNKLMPNERLGLGSWIAITICGLIGLVVGGMGLYRQITGKEEDGNAKIDTDMNNDNGGIDHQINVIKTAFAEKGYEVDSIPLNVDGTNSIVYKAVEVSTQKPVAIRVERKEDNNLLDIEVVENHNFSSLVAVYESGYIALEDNKMYFYQVMELLEGESVQNLFLNHGFVEADPIVLIDSIIEFAEGINKLHISGLSHNELRPSNVMLNNDLKLIATDLDTISDYVAPINVNNGIALSDQAYIHDIAYMMLTQATENTYHESSIKSLFDVWTSTDVEVEGLSAFVSALSEIKANIEVSNDNGGKINGKNDGVVARRSFLKAIGFTMAAATIDPLGFLNVYASEGIVSKDKQETKAFLLGHTHVDSRNISSIKDTLFNSKHIGNMVYDRYYSAAIDSLFNRYQSELDVYNKDIQIINQISRDNDIKTVFLEATQQDIDSIARSGEKMLTMLEEIMQKRNISDYKIKARKGILLLVRPALYMLMTNSLPENVNVEHADDRALKMETNEVYKVYLGSIKDISRKLGIRGVSKVKIKEMLLIMQQLFQEGKEPSLDQIAKLKAGITDSVALKLIDQAMGWGIRFIELNLKRSIYMSKQIEAANGNSIIVAGYDHITEIEMILNRNGQLKTEKIKNTKNNDNGGKPVKGYTGLDEKGIVYTTSNDVYGQKVIADALIDQLEFLEMSINGPPAYNSTANKTLPILIYKSITVLFAVENNLSLNDVAHSDTAVSSTQLSNNLIKQNGGMSWILYSFNTLLSAQKMESSLPQLETMAGSEIFSLNEMATGLKNNSQIIISNNSQKKLLSSLSLSLNQAIFVSAKPADYALINQDNGGIIGFAKNHSIVKQIVFLPVLVSLLASIACSTVPAIKTSDIMQTSKGNYQFVLEDFSAEEELLRLDNEPLKIEPIVDSSITVVKVSQIDVETKAIPEIPLFEKVADLVYRYTTTTWSEVNPANNTLGDFVVKALVDMGIKTDSVNLWGKDGLVKEVAKELNLKNPSVIKSYKSYEADFSFIKDEKDTKPVV
ncbi:MAG: hypothetical protein HQ538_04430, partial [Parcubacteria group bacterium]|nr:hypothetical protein [Parcubacteria group bacterium]